MTTILGYTPAVILGVFSVYYGVAIGYWSFERFLDRLESAVAFLAAFVGWLIIHLSNITVDRVREIGQKLVAGYHVEQLRMRCYNFVKDLGDKEINKFFKFIFRAFMLGLGFSVVLLIVAISLAVQLNEYRQLLLSWLLAPLLISIFGYTVGKYIGAFWFEIEQRPRCYKSKKKEYEYEFSQKKNSRILTVI